nr:biopolymer transporter ExbD [Hyphomonas chukchiensis]
MKFAQQASRSASGKIGMTPLIDVVFILLLFFMLTSTFADRRSMDLATPALSSAPDVADKVIVLDLGAEGLRFNGEPLTLESIDDTLHTRLATGHPVSLQVAAGIPLETSVSVMDALKASGARSIALRNAEGQP